MVMPDMKNLKIIRNERKIKQNELKIKKTEFLSTEELSKDPRKYEEEYMQAEKALSSLDEKIKYLRNALVKKEQLAEVLNYVTSGVKPGEVEFNLISMAALVSQQNFNELNVKIRLTSNFNAFLNFISNLESLPILLKIKQLKLSSPESNGILNADADIVVYVSL